jgi:hypothetical protein
MNARYKHGTSERGLRHCNNGQCGNSERGKTRRRELETSLSIHRTLTRTSPSRWQLWPDTFWPRSVLFPAAAAAATERERGSPSTRARGIRRRVSIDTFFSTHVEFSLKAQDSSRSMPGGPRALASPGTPRRLFVARSFVACTKKSAMKKEKGSFFLLSNRLLV